MNPHTIIVAIASVVIAGTVAFSAFGVVVADGIRLGAPDDEGFSYFRMINGEKVSVCNPTMLYARINGLDITIINGGSQIGQLSLPGRFLEPNSAYVEQGQFTTGVQEEVQYLALHFDAMANDVIPQRIDPASLVITTEVRASILGFVPYSATKSYQAFDFTDMMNGIGEEHAC